MYGVFSFHPRLKDGDNEDLAPRGRFNLLQGVVGCFQGVSAWICRPGSTPSSAPRHSPPVPAHPAIRFAERAPFPALISARVALSGSNALPELGYAQAHEQGYETGHANKPTSRNG